MRIGMTFNVRAESRADFPGNIGDQSTHEESAGGQVLCRTAAMPSGPTTTRNSTRRKPSRPWPQCWKAWDTKSICLVKESRCSAGCWVAIGPIWC